MRTVRNRRSRLTALLAVASLLFVLALGGPVAGRNMQDKPIVLSLDQMVVDNVYPAHIGNSHLLIWSPGSCRNTAFTWCDTIPLIFNTPEANDLHLVTLTLTWDDTRVEAGGETEYAQDMDMYLFNERTRWGTIARTVPDEVFYQLPPDLQQAVDDEEEGWITSTVRIGTAAGSSVPEVMKLAGMAPTKETYDPDNRQDFTNKYWIQISNFSGQSAEDYRLRAELLILQPGQLITGGTLPGPRQVNNSGTAIPPPIAPTKSLEEEPILPVVKVPGPDGELVEYDLMAIAGQVQEEEQKRFSALIPGVIALLLLGAGLFAYFFIRSRRGSPESV